MSEEELLEQEIDRRIDDMTLEQKICQLFIVTPEQLTGLSNVTAAGEATRNSLQQYPVGGIIYFSSNLNSPDQTKKMLSAVQGFSEEIEGVPLFLCIDEELLEAELKPFALAQEKGVDMIMVAHISLPNVIGDDTPCSLSYHMITEILRGELNYKGLIVTDALNMGAISKLYTSSEAAVRAVNAGVDLLLMPSDFKEAYRGLLEAVQNGDVEEDRINDSVRRILKAKLGLE